MLRRIKAPQGAKGAAKSEPPATESTQVLRRIKDPKSEPPADEHTQVLRRINAPRQGDQQTATPTDTGAAAATTVIPRTPAAPAPETASASGGNGSGGSGGGGGKGNGKKPKRTGWRRLVPGWRLVLGTVVVGALLIIGLFFLGYSMVKIPPANALATKQSNVYLYADGSQLARDTRDSQVNRENVNLAEVSKNAQHAVLAAEDRDFYTEPAVDPKAMLRAGWNMATGKGRQSGSTITQQYVKNYYLAQEQTLSRKAKEFFISVKLGREKSKNEILEGYLNTSFFGRGAYGIQAAA
ncbi:penicillin-binding protein, partial [Streptomyces sp. SID4985]|uniref:transglycosylase domain-containing protein n=1 Tax=Streptomyces sp. SID4985 TaxID=2690292 RepID=UPI00136E8577|nr:penicillin-binding protein [Streptomyces sp. SID4985]